MFRNRTFVGSQISDWQSVYRIKRDIYADLGSLTNPALDGVQLYDAGFRTSGLYYINTSTGGIKQVYVDLQTQDIETGKSGWMLAGSFTTASEWTKSSQTSLSTFGSTPVNSFSSSFGTNNIKYLRLHVSSSISLTGANATSADFYFYNITATPWRQWWVSNSSNTIYSTSTVNAGSSWPRDGLKQFTYAHNLKFGYTATTQVWNNFSDNPGIQGDWWNGLSGTQTSIGFNSAGDGSFAIIPQGDTSTGAGQDCNNNQTKFGYDDTGLAAYFGSTATSNLNANTGTSGSNTNLWIWIK